MFLEISQFIFIFGLILLTLSSIFIDIKKIKLSIYLLFLGITFSIISLFISFLTNDFSIHYVYQHSRSTLPALLKIAALWSAHEGSVLIFLFFILVGILIVIRDHKISLSKNITAWRHLSISLCSFCWYFFIFASVYERILPFFPNEGADLNPLLQDTSLSYHPPLLLFGSALLYPASIVSVFYLTGSNSFILYRILLMASIGILTLGITFGSMWAYYVLGWGGWWFWDPVETISLLPWFGGLYLLHESYQKKISPMSLIVWLTILLGQLMVRSNYIISVHSFAQTKSSTGLMLVLAVSAIISIITSFKIYSAKKDTSNTLISLGSKILLISFSIILFGLLWPIIAKIFSKDQIHLDGEFYNIILGTLIGAGLLLWSFHKKDRSYASFISFISFIILSFFFSLEKLLLITLLGFLFGYFQKKKLSWYLHQSVFLFIGLCCLFGTYSSQSEHLLTFNEEKSIDNLKIMIKPADIILDAPEKTIEEHSVYLTLNSGKKFILKPQRIFFHSHHQEIVKMDWHVGIYDEYMVCLGDYINSSKILVRIYHRPFVRLIWLLGIFCGLGLVIYSISKIFFDNSRQSSGKI